MMKKKYCPHCGNEITFKEIHKSLWNNNRKITCQFCGDSLVVKSKGGSWKGILGALAFSVPYNLLFLYLGCSFLMSIIGGLCIWFISCAILLTESFLKCKIQKI